MKAFIRVVSLILGAAVLGWICAEGLCRSAAFRDATGSFAGRGHLLAIAAQTGIYEQDIDPDIRLALRDAVMKVNLRQRSKDEEVVEAGVEHEMTLLQSEFPDFSSFSAALQRGGLTAAYLRGELRDRARSLQWLEKKVAAGTPVTEAECHEFYDSHRNLFALPLRFHAAHIFLAAHAETPVEITEQKRQFVEAIAKQLSHGENFDQLAAQISEDESSKLRSGDLGYFSTSRVPAEFAAEIVKLKAGQTSKPFQSRLGFHIVTLMERRSPSELSFEDARPEIRSYLANKQRMRITQSIAEELSRTNYLRQN